MRCLLLCALALAACDDAGTSAPPDLAMRDLAVPDLAVACVSDCPCMSGLVCVDSASYAEPFASTCLKPCQTDADCGARSCVAMFGDRVRYCLASDEPHTCGVHCDPGARLSHCEGDTLVSTYVGLVCGEHYQACANGCVEDDPDGGDNRQARCL
ncbi:MAG TPA: hypothetical protein VF334_00015 [Polyangia bacterium]